MSINEKIEYLRDTKALIRDAIVDKGIEVTDKDSFRSYAEKIGLIQHEETRSPVDVGPYPSVISNLYSFGNHSDGYPDIQLDLTREDEYEWSSDWWNIEEILDADTENYPAKMIVLYPADTRNTTLYGANFYKTSDGKTYAASERGSSYTHAWDLSKDKINPNGTSYRYVISYFSTQEINTLQSRYNTVNTNAIAVITKGFRWQNTSSSRNSSQPFYQRSRLQYFKSKDSIWDTCWYLSGWFYECYSLRYVEFDFNNRLALVEAPSDLSYMFCRCRDLKHVKFSMPSRISTISSMFNECTELRYFDFDFTHKDFGVALSNTSPFYNGNSMIASTLSYDPNRHNWYDPWIMLAADVPLKVSSLVYVGARHSSSYQDQSLEYAQKEIKVEASNNGFDWTDVGSFKPKLWVQLHETVLEIEDDTAYKYWRFTSINRVSAYFTVQYFKFNAEYEDAATGEWKTWEQPAFTSSNQRGCSIYASGTNESHYSWYAFSLDAARSKYWRSNSLSVGSGMNMNHLYADCPSLRTVYVKGGHKIPFFACSYWDAQYIIFENTDSANSFGSSFAYNERLLGVVIPNVDNVGWWGSAFNGCSALTVAPEIKITDKVTNVDYMFKGTAVHDITHLDLSEARTVHGMFREMSAGLTQVDLDLPNAKHVSCVFYRNEKIEQVKINAPKAVTLNRIAEDAKSLHYIRVSGTNSEEDHLEPWTGPSFSSNTTWGTLSKDDSLTISDGDLWNMLDDAVNYKGWGVEQGHHVRFRGTGSIYWDLPEYKFLRFNALYLCSGYSTLADGQFRGRFYADREKTIPLTEEFVTSDAVWSSVTIPVLESMKNVDVNCVVLDIVENIGGYASIGELSFDATGHFNAHVEDTEHAFKNCTNLTHIDMNTSKSNNMQYFCYNCSSLMKVPDVSFESATNLDYAFYGCDGITELNGICFPKAEALNNTFSYCAGLVSVDGLDLPVCKSMQEVFYGCDSLYAVTKPKWLLVESLKRVFVNCFALKTVDISNLDLVSDFYEAFSGCSQLITATLSSVAPKNNMYSAFYECSKLRKVELGDTSLVENMNRTFYNCKRLFHVSEMSLDSCVDLDYAFYNCHWLTSVVIANLDSVVDMEYAFAYTIHLTSISLPAMPSMTNFKHALQGSAIASVTIESMPVCTDASYAFNGCWTLKEVNLPDTSSITNWTNTFSSCSSLEEIEIPSTVNAQSLNSLFDYDGKLRRVNDLDTSKVTDFTNTFRFCNSLESSPVKTVTSKVQSMQGMFEECDRITDWSFLNDYDVSGCSNMSYMFRRCKFPSFSLTNWNWKSDVNLAYMFDYNANLKSLTLDFKDRTVAGNGYSCTRHAYMFQYCDSLEELNLVGTKGFSGFNYMFYGTPFKAFILNLADFSGSSAFLQGAFSNCPNLESLTINYNNIWYTDNINYYGSYASHTPFYHIVSNSPKLKSISLVNVQNMKNWGEAFYGMNNEEDCTIYWNGASYDNISAYGMFAYCSGKGCIKHEGLVRQDANPAWKAFSVSNPEGYMMEPMYEEGELILKLPTEVQIRGVSFAQRADSDGSLYDSVEHVQLFADEGCVTPITEVLHPRAGSNKIESAIVDDIVTDKIVCKFGRDLGRYQGIGQLDILARAKGERSTTDWTQPALTSNGTMGGSSCACAANSVNGESRANQVWYAFDQNGTTNCWSSANSSLPDWITFYSPDPLYVSSVYLHFQSTGEAYQGGLVQGSNDNDSWTNIGSFSNNSDVDITVQCSDTESFNYIRLYLTTKTNTSYWGRIATFKINAKVGSHKYHPWSEPTVHADTPWIQKLAVSNTSFGLVAASSEEASGYAALGVGQWKSYNYDTAPYWNWILPNEIKCSKIEFDSEDIATCQLYHINGKFTIGEPIKRLDESIHFSVEFEEPISLVDIRIVPLTRADGRPIGVDYTVVEGEGNDAHDVTYHAPISLKNILLTGTYNPDDLIDFRIPADPSSAEGYELKASPAFPVLFDNTDNSYWHYKADYMYYNYKKPEIHLPIFLQNIAYSSYLNKIDDSGVGDSLSPVAVHNFDIIAPTHLGGNISNWFERSNSRRPTALTGVKNIICSTSLNFPMNYETLKELLNALVSRAGWSTQTLNIGSDNIAKLSDEEKAVATRKNWNLA